MSGFNRNSRLRNFMEHTYPTQYHSAIGTDTRQIEALPAEGDTLGISFPGVCARWEAEPN